MRVGLREANQRFSKIMKAVRNGTEVVLTERGKPIARITRIKLSEEDEMEAALDRMASIGLLRRAEDPRPMPPFKPFRATGESTTVTIRRDRDER
jgi:prevent-host-death family protein